MAAGENEGQVVKPAPSGKVSILMIIVVGLIITVIVDRPLEVLEPTWLRARAASAPLCPRSEVDVLDVDCIRGCVQKAPICAGILDGQWIGTRQ